MQGGDIPKQRGIYSEILTTEDTENLKLVSTIGPSQSNVIQTNVKQKMPRALGIKRKQQGAPSPDKTEKDTKVTTFIDPTGKILGKNYFRDGDVNMGFYSKKREGVADVDPKVMEPFVPIPGKPPRKVVIDRQRKLFASLNIEDLLLDLGIDYKNPQKTQADWLPLEPFDDTEYDCRLPDEWISYGYDENGNFYPITGKGLWKDDEERGFWRPVLISNYDKDRATYTGVWDDSGEYCELTRINLLFSAEDPRIFAQRVAQAHQERIYADSQIRYNFFIDCMPKEELPELDSEQSNRIVEMAKSSKYIKDMIKKGAVEHQSILSDVVMDFGRTMNQIIMEKTMEKSAEQLKDMIPANLSLPPKSLQKETPYFGMVPIPQHDFPEQFSNFCFNSLYIKEEVIRAMVEIRAECNDLLVANRIFDTSIAKTLRVEEFKQYQTSSISAIKYATRETGWVGKLEKITKASFTDVGKGWFNIQETSPETYEFGKLKKFLTLVNFMMQDTVLTMCKESVRKFVAFILQFIPVSSQIFSTDRVINTFDKVLVEDEEATMYDSIPESELTTVQQVRKELGKMFDKNKDPEPLFALDLILKPNQIIPQYSTDPKEIVAKVMEVFDEGIECLQQIPQLEPILMRHLFKTHGKKMLKAPLRPRQKPKPADPNNKRVLPDENTWLWDAYDTVKSQLEHCIEPLYEYVKTFEQFDGESKLNPDKHVKSLDEGEHPITAEGLRADIQKHRDEEKRLKEAIPEFIVVSIFNINCKDIRNMYVGKHSAIIEKEIKLIAQKAKDMNYRLSTEFDKINERMRKIPKNIEEMTETKKFMTEIPITVEKLKNEIQDCVNIYDILDEYGYDSFTTADLDQKWQLFGAPKKVVEVIEQQTSVLAKQAENFVKQMEEEQIEFEETLDNLAITVGGFHSFDDLNRYEEIAVDVESVNQRLQDSIEQSRLFNQREFLVGKEQKDYSRLAGMAKDFQPYSNLWLTTRNWFKSHRSWLNDPWEQLNATDLDNIFENSNKTISQVLRFFREKEYPKILKIAETMKKNIDDFKPYVPLAVALRKEGMKERHWDQLSAKVGFDIRPVEGFTLTSVIDAGMLKYVDACDEIGEKAYKEFHIEKSLNKMQSEWKDCNFLLPQFKQTTTNYISGFDDAMAMLDEHLVTSQAMQFSPFKKPFEAEINEWSAKMMLVSETLEEWVKCQGQWMYLQPIFDSPDIMKQLPIETKRFKSVDSTWRHILGQTKQTPNILITCSKEGLKEKFQEANKNLEIVQKGLADYLEKKRSVFSRFFFLSNDELLEILSQTKEVRNVRPHLRKVFEAMADLEFKDDDTIWAMFSGEGEKINFVKKIDPKDRNVEYWMGDVEKMMVASVRQVLLKSIEDYKLRSRNDWILQHPGMCVLNGSQVHWTAECEEALNTNGNAGIKTYLEMLNKQLIDTVVLVRQKLSKNATITINALIVIDVHAKDVVARLAEENIEDVNAFEWISQLRYYWENDDCYVKCVQTNFPYGYEYLGNSLRLVITPLTDKCYMTLMGALNLNLGGAPAGPAGTGKTESTKDLAKALAKQCVVFNCSDGMDHIMVAKFFKGLTSAGAWACFDEFNRINIEVLSVIAQQLLVLFRAKAQGDPEINFYDSLIKMKPTFCVFITMNPGYAGRTELPDNLKALFRPVAMMVPDYALIGEIMLYSFGFLTGRDLARKMVTTFKLSSEQLSSQDHYDYGMRAVRSVINAAGLLKRANQDMNEDQLLLRALRDVNVPKFLKDDLPLFENIILDLFPGVEKPAVNYGDLFSSLNKTCETFNLQPVDQFIMKIIQLYDTIQVRHGLMIVGPTGGGKTSNYKTLQHAMSALSHQEMFEKVHVDILNPKSITMDQLYGFVDPQTSEWQDGVLAKLVVECTKDESADLHWVMFDGPVDAIWIENMNTVLDDNKKLCLNSGQIITLSSRMTMMFEVEDLAVASPATVSRCGMVYMEPASLTLAPLVKSWISQIPIKVKESKMISGRLQELYDMILVDACYFVRKTLVEPVKTVDNNLTLSSMRILDCYFNNYIESEIKRVTKEQIAELESMLNHIFLFAVIWSIGATVTMDGRIQFDKWIRERMPAIGVNNFPEEKLVYDYKWNHETKEWQNWMTTISGYEVDIKASFNEILVPTLDSIRMKFMVKMLIANKKHCLTPGPTGVGKSVNINELMTYELNEEYQTLAMTFSAQTSANQTQDYLDDKFDKRRKNVFGPPAGKKFIIFIDDLNMPKKEEYGAQPPLELLRQFMDHQGWYDRKSKEKPFMKMEDLVFIAAMGPPGGGRSEITQRLQRHFNIMTYTDVQQESIVTIFETIISAFYYNFSKEIKESLSLLVQMTLRVYDNVLHGPLKPTPNKSHYTFNLRDISRIFQGLCNANNKLMVLPVQLSRMWIHENKRVFGDRLIDNIDRDWLDGLLVQEAETTYSLTKKEIFNSDRLIFGDYMQGIDSENRIYMQVENLKGFVTKIEEYLEEYNSAVKQQMKLVMFLDACDHVSRIERVIRQPLGNALCLGVGGSGRQSLARLATFIANYKIYQIEVVKGYSMSNWRDDVKKALLQAGAENKSTSFVFVDTQIINEQMLEDINNILNSGDVPNLYKVEDLDPINKVGRLICMEKGIAISKMNMFSSYLSRVKKNIHMIIAMSPLGEIFRSRIRKFPSLVNCCTIDWFTEWPEEALLGVGKGQVTAEDLSLGKMLDPCVEMFKCMHQSVEVKSKAFLDQLRRTNYVTPTSFLELLSMYKTILFDKRKEIDSSKRRLIRGLQVLEEAAVEIAKLKEHIDKMTPELEITKKDVEQTMKELSRDKAAADAEKEIVSKDEAEATQQESEASVLKAEAEGELAKATPLLEEATRVLKELKVSDFYDLKAINKPTATVVLGMEVSCHMMGLKPKKTAVGKVEGDTGGYFVTAKENLLSAPQKFLDSMMVYDKENIPEAVVKKVNAILLSDDFTTDKVKNASNALLGVRKWVNAMMQFHELLKIVNPKREKVNEMNEKLAIVRANLVQKRKRLREVEDKIESLERLYRDKLEQEAGLQQQIGDCYKKLERAGKIISGLEGEKTRWTQTVERLDKDFNLLIGNCLVAAGMVAYAGAFTAQFRTELEAEWRQKIKELKIVFYDQVSMKGLLEDAVKTKIWTAASLPNDNLSIENAIIMFKSRRWPLMIDPQNQANKFIKNLGKDEAESGLEIFKMSDASLLKQLELGIQFGKWVLIENVGEEMDPALEPILLKQVDKTGSLKLGDKSIPYNNSFKFFMTTTIPNPHYSPETSVKVTILNFAITPFGLEEQMLNQFVSQEMPELQKKKDTIVQQNAQSAKVLVEIEDKILEGLTKNAKIADILEDDELIKILDESKKTSDEITVRMKESEITEKEIDKTREIYRPVAYRASILFFTIIDLAVIDPMYQYSLQWFSNLFGQSVDNSTKSNESDQRIKFLNDHFTVNLYDNVCRSLFEKHKLLFSFTLTVKILFGSNLMDADEWRYFLAGPSGEIQVPKNPTDWLGDLQWAETYKQIYGMAQLPAFKGYEKFFIQHHKEFQKIFDSIEPHNMPQPGEWNKKINTFQKLIALKCIRPDKMTLAVQNFICEKLSKEFIEPPTFNLAKSYKDSSVTTPLIFVLSPGSDPVAGFLKFAEEMNMSKKLESISLGRGQDKKASNMIEEGAINGRWVLLMNCHLATSFMPKLEQIVENLDDSNHREFRLWLTSMPSKDFPVSTLQNSVKMTLEPPTGLRQNILRTYEAFDPKDFEDCTKPEIYKKLMFGFSFFHAIVQDRRKFGAIGWNIAYEFTNEDLMVSIKQLKTFIQEYDLIPYKVLNYIGAEINYGGRVTDDKDSRLIITILRTYINEGILEDGYKFSTSGIYYSPAPGEREEYIDYIKTLPLNPSPEAFGLHENAEITTSQNTTINLLMTILTMQPRASTGSGKTREQIIGEMAAFIQTRTPKPFDLEEVGKKFPTSYEESTNTVLFQECVRYNRLLIDMAIGLVSCQKALKGEVVMSEELEKMSNSIFDNLVPKKWQEVGFLSQKPLASWIQDLNDRVNFLTDWITNGTPKVFWISGFFFPQAFLTGTLQNYSRKNIIAIDRVQFNFEFVDTKTFKEIKEKPQDGCYVYGMYLEGCKWDYKTHQLEDSDPKKLFEDIPLLLLKPQENRVTPKTGIYNAPVYKVLSRAGTLSTTGHSTNFVMWLELPSSVSQDKWIKAGVAAFLALRY